MSATSPDPLSVREKIAYGLGDTASNFIFHTFNVFLFYYYTDVFGLAAGVVGTMYLVARLWDAVNDPMMGAIADRTSTRWGRYRPYLLWMALPFGVMGYLVFANPALGETGKLVYACVTYTVMMMVYTAINVPYSALLGVISPVSAERTVVSSYRFVCAFGGQLLIVAAARPLIAHFGAEDEARGFQVTMAIFAAISVGLFLFSFGNTRERVQVPPDQVHDLRTDLRLLWRNRPWLVLFVAGVLKLANVAIRGAVTVLYFKYFVRDDGRPWLGVFDLTTVFLTSGTLALLAGAGCAAWFARLGDKRLVLMLLSAANAVAMLVFFLLPADAIGAMLVVNIIGTFVAGPTPALVWAMFADTADYGEWKFGRRSTALVFSTAQFAQKMGLTLGGALAGWGMAWSGFVAQAEQTASGLLGLRLLFTVVPGTFALLGAVAIWFYPLRESDVLRIEAELAGRRNA